MKQGSRYFMAIFGEEYATEAPVDGGHYKPYEGWINNIGISKGDKMLLYCCRRYPGYDKETPALGEVTHKEEREGEVFAYYKYKSLVPPIKWAAINECLREEERRKFRNPRNKPSWLFENEPSSFWCAVGEREVN